MNLMFDGAEVVREGIWLYDTLSCKIRIIKWNVLYGTGDFEDEPEIRDDREIECYYAIFESPVNRGCFKSSSSGFLTINEVISEAEKMIRQKITWDK